MLKKMAVLVCLVLCAGSQLSAQQYVGYVVRVTGSWTLQNSADPAHPVKVAQWQELPLGCRLVPAEHEGRVSVWLVDGRIAVFDAAKPETWKQPIKLNSPAGSAGDKWIALAMRWLAAKPQVVVPAMARGSREVEPIRDQVVQWSSTGVDLATLLGAAVHQPLVIRFEPLSAEGRPIPEQATILDWDPAGSKKPSISVGPALYRMVVLDPEGLKAGQEAWVLVVKPAEFATRARLFEDLVRIAAPWAKDDARLARGFLRGGLLSLANEPPGS